MPKTNGIECSHRNRHRHHCCYRHRRFPVSKSRQIVNTLTLQLILSNNVEANRNYFNGSL